MLVRKLSNEEKNNAIKGITLLSGKEYETSVGVIPMLGKRFWLQSPARFDYPNKKAASMSALVGVVGANNKISDSYSKADTKQGVRPALLIDNTLLNLSVNEKVVINELSYTVISNDKILCDSIIGNTAFNRSAAEEKDCVFENSDIKEWLGKWLDNEQKKHEISIKVNEITLPSKDEIEKWSEFIPSESKWYWLRTSGKEPGVADIAGKNNKINGYGDEVDNKNGVRPLVMFDTDGFEPMLGAKLIKNEVTYTVISSGVMIADKIVGSTHFCASKDSEESNDYVKSDVKTWLEDWAGQEFGAVKENYNGAVTVVIQNTDMISVKSTEEPEAVAEEAVIVEEAPQAEDVPVMEEAAVAEVPVAEEAAKVEEAPVAEETLAVENASAGDAVAAAEEATVVEEAVAAEDTQVTEEVATVAEVPVAEETAEVEEAPVAEETPAVENAPVGDVVASVEENTVVEELPDAPKEFDENVVGEEKSEVVPDTPVIEIKIQPKEAKEEEQKPEAETRKFDEVSVRSTEIVVPMDEAQSTSATISIEETVKLEEAVKPEEGAQTEEAVKPEESAQTEEVPKSEEISIDDELSVADDTLETENTLVAEDADAASEAPAIDDEYSNSIYELRLKKWEIKCDEVKAQRDEMYDTLLDHEYDRIEAEIRSKHAPVIERCKGQIDIITLRKADYEIQLERLGVLRFSEKKKLRAAIVKCDIEIADYENKLKVLQKAYDEELDEIVPRLEKAEPDIVRLIEERLPFPDKPVKGQIL
ncbi:MAG: hypothetical protein IJL20_04990 [Lachnospiraceae bacterium]|nr:hypothetical protein [Lachnospiraceae bacterium]